MTKHPDIKVPTGLELKRLAETTHEFLNEHMIQIEAIIEREASEAKSKKK